MLSVNRSYDAKCHNISVTYITNKIYLQKVCMLMKASHETPQPRVPSKEAGAAGTVEFSTGPLPTIWTDGAYQP